MINAILLLINPVAAWDRLMARRLSVLHILCLHVLPLLLLVGVVEAAALVHWGRIRGELGATLLVPRDAAIHYAVVKFFAQVIFTFVAALVVHAIGQSFRAKHGFTQAFTLVAFSLAPYYTLQLLDALPFLPDWVVWIIAVAVTCAPLYQGVPKTLEPDPPQTFGIYFMGAFTLVGLSGVVAFICHTLLARLTMTT